MTEDYSFLGERIQTLDERLIKDEFYSYDPYDGLTSPVVGLIKSQQNLKMYLEHGIRLFPFNLRPLFGIHKQIHTKTISDSASACALLGKYQSEDVYQKRTKDLLALLWSLRLSAPSGNGWGLRFPVTTRFVNAGINTGNLFNTINAIHSFLDGFELTGSDQYLDQSQSGLKYAKDVLGYREIEDYVVWNYWEESKSGFYNINGLMVGLLGRLYALNHDENLKDLCYRTYRFIQIGQNQDGSWQYSADSRGKWVDGFHTGYILEGICRAILGGVLQPDNTLKKGLEFYLQNLFTSDSLPKYYTKNVYPIDIQNCAQAIQTQVFLIRVGLCTTKQLLDTYQSIESHLWNERSHYYNYQRTRWWTNHIPMHRWGTAPMLLALVYLWIFLCKG